MSEVVERREPPIELILISGFLGSGKTTLLSRILDGCKGMRLGVIVNEFGQIGIDGKLIEKEGVKMVEINGGSIFCACLKDGFIRTLQAFSEQPVDLLVIENSGMADPSSMNRLLAALSPRLKRQYAYAGSVCVADCTSFLQYADLFLSLERQVTASSVVIVNKTDMCPPETVAKVRAKIAAINPQARILEAVHAGIPLEIILSGMTYNGHAGESCNTYENRPASVVLGDGRSVCGVEQIVSFCEAVQDRILRAKGFFRTRRAFFQLDVSSSGVDVREIPLDVAKELPDTKIVVIAKTEAFLPEVKRAWAEMCEEALDV